MARRVATRSSRSRQPCASPPAGPSGRSGSPSGHHGAVTTASCAGAPTAHVRATGAGSGRCAPRWSDSRRASIPSRRHGCPACPARPTRGRRAMPMSTWCLASRSPTRSPADGCRGPARVGGRARRRPRWRPSSRSWRRSAGGWRCSAATDGTGTTRCDPRRRRSCGPRRGQPGSSTAWPMPGSSVGWLPISPSSARRATGSMARRSTVVRWPRSVSRASRSRPDPEASGDADRVQRPARILRIDPAVDPEPIGQGGEDGQDGHQAEDDDCAHRAPTLLAIVGLPQVGTTFGRAGHMDDRDSGSVNGTTGGALDVERDSDVPISTQIYWQLAYQIDSGRLLPGSRLPPVRELGAALRVNPNTIRAVYRRLSDAGYVTSRHGAGTHVAERPPQRRGAEALAGIVAEMMRRASHAGFTADELATATFAAATERRRPGPLVRVLYAECTNADAGFDAERLTDEFPGLIEAEGALLDDLPERLDRFHYDLVATTTFHADEAQAHVAGRVPVVAMLVGPAFMSLVQEISALPPGSAVGVVCGSQRGVESIAEVLQLAGTRDVRIISAVAHTEDELERVDREADIVLLSREALALGLDGRFE